MVRYPAAPPAGYPTTRLESEDCSTPVATSVATPASSCKRTAPSAIMTAQPSKIPSTARCMGRHCKVPCMGRCRLFPGPALPLTQAASTVHGSLRHLRLWFAVHVQHRVLCPVVDPAAGSRGTIDGRSQSASTTHSQVFIFFFLFSDCLKVCSFSRFKRT